MIKLCWSLILIQILAGCSGEAPPNEAPDHSVAGISGSEIRAHIEALAADAMNGREAGTVDYDRAASYVASEYSRFGLAPLGDGQSFMQNIDFFETRLIPDSAQFRIQRGDVTVDLEFREDFVRSGGYGHEDETITAPLVFVGHGIVAPEYEHDDYEGIDVAGKILVMLSGAPPHFATDQRAYYSSSRTKSAIASELGAAGIVSLRTPIDQERVPWSRYLPGVGRPGMRWLDDSGAPYNGYPEFRGSATLSEKGAETVFQLAGQDLEAIFEKHALGGTGSFELGVDATLARRSEQRSVTSANVVGLIKGSDPILRDEYVVYTAHLDHIGVREGKDGDDIHNGAYDNAAGIGVILAAAREMSENDVAPRRSVIFAAVTGEEKGLQGSSYFAKNPPVDAGQLVANINIDMPYLAFPVADVEAYGAEHSSLEAAVREATAALGLELTPDPMPEQVRFVRSDQFSFVQEGIPALAFKAGAKSSDPDIDGKAMLDDFLKNHYHQASDDLALPYSADGAARFAQAASLLGLIVANADERPRWNKPDFFGDKYAK